MRVAVNVLLDCYIFRLLVYKSCSTVRRSLESTVERTESERVEWEHEATSARELAAAKQHQVTTLTDLLDAAKEKVIREIIFDLSFSVSFCLSFILLEGPYERLDHLVLLDTFKRAFRRPSVHV